MFEKLNEQLISFFYAGIMSVDFKIIVCIDYLLRHE